MSIGNEAYNVLSLEAKNRDVTVQQLLRAVVVPDWIKENISIGSKDKGVPHLFRGGLYKQSAEERTDMLVSPAARLRQ